MKVYGVNYDGRYRAIVAASSKRAVAEILGCSLNHVRDFGETTGNAEEIAVASAQPGVAFLRRSSDWQGPWLTLEEYKQRLALPRAAERG